MKKISDRERWDPVKAQRLQQRQSIIRTIREDLYNHNFLEVETPLIVKGTCPDVHIDSVSVENGYLVTSTEYQIKRMIVGGFSKLFTLTKNFRAHDVGRYHSAEFTMLEWARAHETLDSIEEDAVRFIQHTFRILYPQQSSLKFNNHQIDFLNTPWPQLSVRNAFKTYLGLENLDDFSLEPLLKAIKKAQIEVPQDFQRNKLALISYLFDVLQKHLGTTVPTFLQEWPAYMTTSAPINKNDPYVADRSELYIGAIEIADGFPFLQDAVLQRTLFDEALRERKIENKEPVTIDERFLHSLEEGLPQGAGMALGIDRLVMVLTEASRLADVQAFSWDDL